MKFLLALGALVACVFADPFPQGVPVGIAPTTPSPAGCSKTFNGNFLISVVNVTNAKRDLSERAAVADCSVTGTLVLKLTDGVLTDPLGRIGSVVANYQFQFDGPPQAGAIYTGGFCVASNGTLTLGSSSVFYQCLSGNFYNLYDRHWAAQCNPVFVDVIGCSDGSASAVATSGVTSTITSTAVQVSTAGSSVSSTTATIVSTLRTSANATVPVQTTSASNVVKTSSTPLAGNATITSGSLNSTVASASVSSALSTRASSSGGAGPSSSGGTGPSSTSSSAPSQSSSIANPFTVGEQFLAVALGIAALAIF